MSIPPIIPNYPNGITFPSSPIEADIFSPTGSLDSFDIIPNISRAESPEIPESEILNFIEGISQDFSRPSDVPMSRQLISVFEAIAAENALPFQPGNVYHVFRHANMPSSLNNVARTLALAGTVQIDTASVTANGTLEISPRIQTIRNFAELIRWHAI